MNREDIMKKFCELYETSADESIVTSSVLKKAMKELIDANPEAAAEIVETYEGMLHYNNYLTTSEAEVVVSKLENADGTRGPRWKDKEDLLQHVVAMGGHKEVKPDYNCNSLYVMMNIVSSDHYPTIAKLADNSREKYMEICYNLAAEKLSDKDKPNFIRWYLKFD